MEKLIRIGMDTSKHVFELNGMNGAEQAVLRKRLPRDHVAASFARLPSTVIALEACGGSHHWARLLQALDHEVKLIPPQ